MTGIDHRLSLRSHALALCVRRDDAARLSLADHLRDDGYEELAAAVAAGLPAPTALAEIESLERACWGGVLRRVGRDRWEWCDGTPAPEVRDLRVYDCHGSFRVVVRTDADPREDGWEAWVPEAVARDPRNGELAWVADLADAGVYRRDKYGGRGRGREVICVPWADWLAVSEFQAVGATWDTAHEPAVLERARSLGAVI